MENRKINMNTTCLIIIYYKHSVAYNSSQDKRFLCRKRVSHIQSKMSHQQLRGSALVVGRREVLCSKPCRSHRSNCSEFSVVFFEACVNTDDTVNILCCIEPTFGDADCEIHKKVKSFSNIWSHGSAGAPNEISPSHGCSY